MLSNEVDNCLTLRALTLYRLHARQELHNVAAILDAPVENRAMEGIGEP